MHTQTGHRANKGKAPGKAGATEGRRLWRRGRKQLLNLADAPAGRHDCPPSGTQLSQRMSLYHDEPGNGLFACTLGDRPFLRITAYQFSGSYLSLALALRKVDLERASVGSVVSVLLSGTSSRPLTVFMRLNLRSAETSETLYETVVADRVPIQTGFDLAGVRMAFETLEAVWLDVIFSEPAMWQMDIDKLHISVDDGGVIDD